MIKFPRLNNAAELMEGTNIIDILSNGFKLRTNNEDTNQNGQTYTFFAFAESPFKNSRAR